MNVQTKIKFTLGYFRILHSLPDMPSVDVYVNDKLITADLLFGEYTTYFPMVQDRYTICLYKAGTKEIPLITNTLEIKPKELFTLATIKKKERIVFLSIPDANIPIISDKAMLRFINLSPDTSPLDISFSDETLLFTNVASNEGTQYIPLVPLTYTLQVKKPSTSSLLLTIPNINLDPNYFYTIYVIGLLKGKPKLQGFYLLDSFK